MWVWSVNQWYQFSMSRWESCCCLLAVVGGSANGRALPAWPRLRAGAGRILRAQCVAERVCVVKEPDPDGDLGRRHHGAGSVPEFNRAAVWAGAKSTSPQRRWKSARSRWHGQRIIVRLKPGRTLMKVNAVAVEATGKGMGEVQGCSTGRQRSMARCY